MKLGAFGVIRVGMMMLPEGALYWAPWVGGVAVLNIVWGAMAALSQKDLKYIIAYSSVSHMGVVMLGAATLTVDGWNGAIYQMVAHGIMTGLFFALVGLIYSRAHTRWVPDMGGFAKVMPGVGAFFVLAGLSSLGLPGLAGFVAEFLVFLGAWQSDHSWWAIPGVVGAWITAIYVLRTVRDIFYGPGPAEGYADLSEAKGSEWYALYMLGACLIIFGSLPSSLLEFIHRSTAEYLPAILPAVSAATGVAVGP
jgi:NADH-quinone oxidoreductase subunit M